MYVQLSYKNNTDNVETNLNGCNNIHCQSCRAWNLVLTWSQCWMHESCTLLEFSTYFYT